MRREERHHLKENPLAVFLADLQETLSERGRAVAIVALMLILGAVSVVGYVAWQETQRQRAGDALAVAMAVLEAEVSEAPGETDTGAGPTYPTWQAKFEAALPKLREAADAYPDTAQGLQARYQVASVLAGLDRPDEAATEYQRVIDTAGDELYRLVGRMGLAEAHLTAGRYQDAIAILEAQTSAVESAVPVDAVLMRLGHVYREAGQPDDALAAFTRVTEEFPTSVYAADAQTQADALRQGEE